MYKLYWGRGGRRSAPNTGNGKNTAGLGPFALVP